MDSRFATRSFGGDTRQFFFVEAVTVDSDTDAVDTATVTEDTVTEDTEAGAGGSGGDNLPIVVN